MELQSTAPSTASKGPTPLPVCQVKHSGILHCAVIHPAESHCQLHGIAPQSSTQRSNLMASAAGTLQLQINITCMQLY